MYTNPSIHKVFSEIIKKFSDQETSLRTRFEECKKKLDQDPSPTFEFIKEQHERLENFKKEARNLSTLIFLLVNFLFTTTNGQRPRPKSTTLNQKKTQQQAKRHSTKNITPTIKNTIPAISVTTKIELLLKNLQNQLRPFSSSSEPIKTSLHDFFQKKIDEISQDETSQLEKKPENKKQQETNDQNQSTVQKISVEDQLKLANNLKEKVNLLSMNVLSTSRPVKTLHKDKTIQGIKECLAQINSEKKIDPNFNMIEGFQFIKISKITLVNKFHSYFMDDIMCVLFYGETEHNFNQFIEQMTKKIFVLVIVNGFQQNQSEHLNLLRCFLTPLVNPQKTHSEKTHIGEYNKKLDETIFALHPTSFSNKNQKQSKSQKKKLPEIISHK